MEAAQTSAGVASIRRHYFRFDGRCERALPAAVLLALPVLPLCNTLEAALAAFALVTLDLATLPTSLQKD